MRLLARPPGARFRGSAHSLRSAYNHFVLVEPFPNGILYFKRVVDRPVCVYVIGDKLFVLGSDLQAFTIQPARERHFRLSSPRGFLSPGEYLDGDTCLPTADWREAKAWERLCLADPPHLDQAELAAIAFIDRKLLRPADCTPNGEAAECAVRFAGTTNLKRADRKQEASIPAAIAPAEPFNGSVDLCLASHAAGWAAKGSEPAAVSVYVNEVWIGEAKPEGERPDVAAAGFARYSAWSYLFPRQIEVADRLAFRFPDGSPLPRPVGGDRAS